VDLDTEQDELRAWLDELRTEHRDLDDLIHLLTESRHPDLMQLQRLKKRKLRLKDMIARIGERLDGDDDLASALLASLVGALVMARVAPRRDDANAILDRVRAYWNAVADRLDEPSASA